MLSVLNISVISAHFCHFLADLSSNILPVPAGFMYFLHFLLFSPFLLGNASFLLFCSFPADLMGVSFLHISVISALFRPFLLEFRIKSDTFNRVFMGSGTSLALLRCLSGKHPWMQQSAHRRVAHAQRVHSAQSGVRCAYARAALL